MYYWLEYYIICFFLSVLLGGIIIPNIMTIAFRRKLFDEVDERKIHRGVVPRLGGISFLPAFIFSFCIVVGFNLGQGIEGVQSALVSTIVPVMFLLCALMLMYLVGIADDLIGVRYRAKFIFQIIAGILIVMSGVWIHGLDGFLWIREWPNFVGWIVSVFVVIAVVNAINLIDGIDGLASGLCMIALAFYSYVFISSEEYIYALLCGAVMGTLMPFFYYNVFGTARNHTKIFMGDTGSLTLGTILSFMAILILCIDTTGKQLRENLFILAIVPILVPGLDVARVFLHRIKNGKNPFLPDKCHIHHKLLALGCRQWQALLLILALDACFILANLIISAYVNPTWIILGDIILWTLLNIWLTRRIRSKERACGEVLYL